MKALAKQKGPSMNIITAPFQKFAQFSGRSRRTEFWCFALFYVLATAAANYVDTRGGDWQPVVGRFGMVELIVSVLLLLPIVAVGIRRLHDSACSGWNSLLLGVPYVGWLFTADNRSAELFSLGGVSVGLVALTLLLVQPGDAGSNAYGASPHG